MKINEVFKIDRYSEAYEFAIANDCTIQEIGRDENGARQFKIVKIERDVEAETLGQLREQREVECFAIINRGVLWYNTLTEQQKLELDKWYKAWLDVTETMVIPEKPSWLK